MAEQNLPVIKIVGVSASGKSTLVDRLRQAGYNARAVSQEHSNVADLWRQFDRTSVLIYLDANLEVQRQRRPDVTWDATNLQNEQLLLTHARDHADLKIDTSALTAETVWQIVEAFLRQQQVRHAVGPLALGTATGSALRATPAPAPVIQPVSDQRKRKKRKRTSSES